MIKLTTATAMAECESDADSFVEKIEADLEAKVVAPEAAAFGQIK